MESSDVLMIVSVFLLLCILGLLLYNQFKDKFSNILDAKNCDNSPIRNIDECKKIMNTLSSDISTSAQGQPANRGITSNSVESGSFANPNVINPVQEIVGIQESIAL
jgi:hypothetical protein